MAASSEGSFSFEVLTNLTCCMCDVQFRVSDFYSLPTSQAPILLQCLHSVCVTCVKRKSGKVFCTICREPQIADSTDYNMYHIGHLVAEKSTRRRFNQEKKISLFPVASIVQEKSCDECKSAAKVACKQCKFVFCNICWDLVHSAAKVLRSHQKMSLDELVLSQDESCIQHNERITLFCQECDKALCSSCGHDSGHNPVPLIAYNISILEALKSAGNDVAAHVKTLENTLKLVHNERKNVRGYKAQCYKKKEIVDFFSKLIGLLQMEQKKALQTVSQISCQDIEDLTNMEADILAQIKNIKQLQLEKDLIIDPSNSKGLNGSRILKGLQEATAKPCRLAKNDSCDDIEISFGTDLFKNLVNVVTIKRDDINKSFVMVRDCEYHEDDSISNSAGRLLLSALTLAEDDQQSSASAKSSSSSRSLPKDSMWPRKPYHFENGKMIPVEMAHFVDVNNFYVYVNDEKNLFQKLQKEMNACSPPPLVKSPYNGMKVTVNHEGSLYRAVINNLMHQSAIIHLVDVGLEKRVPFSNLKFGIMKFSSRPLVNDCMLDLPNDQPMHSLEHLKQILQLPDIKLHFRLVQKVQNKLIGDLVITCKDDYVTSQFSVKDYLMQTATTLPAYCKRDYKPPSFLEVNLNEQNAVYFKRVVTDDLIYLQTAEASRIRRELEKEMNEFYDKNDIRNDLMVLKRDLPCAVRSSKLMLWCRGLIIINKEGRFYVQLVDYGEKVAFKWDTCRRLHTKFLNYPRLVFLAKLPRLHTNRFNNLVRYHLDSLKMVELFAKVLEWNSYNTPVVELRLRNGSNICELMNDGDRAIFSGEKPKIEVATVPAPNPTENSKFVSDFVDDDEAAACAELASYASPDFEDDDEAAACAELASFAPPSGPKQYRSSPPLLAVHSTPKPSQPEEANEDQADEDNDEAAACAELASFAPPSGPRQYRSSPPLLAAHSTPKPSQPEEVNQEQADEDDSADLSIEIDVVKVISPDLFYFSLPNYKEKLKEMSYELKSHYVAGCIEENEWVLGDLVAYQSREHGKWLRGEICGETDEEGNIKVHAYDIAEHEYVSTKRMARLSKFAENKILLRGRLVGIIPRGEPIWPSDVCEHFQTICKTAESTYISRKASSSSSMLVEMFVKKTTFPSALAPKQVTYHSVNFMLAQLPNVTTTRSVVFGKFNLFDPSNEKKSGEHLDEDEATNGAKNSLDMWAETQVIHVTPVGKKYLPAEPLSGHTINAKVYFIDHRCVFYFIDLSIDGKKLEKINEDLMMRFCDSKPCPDDTFWEKGECCVALYYGTGGWFRVQVIDVLADADDLKYVVEFVDYGNIEVCKPDELRKGAAFWDVPILAHTCFLADYELNPDDADALEKLLAMCITQTWRIERLAFDKPEPFPSVMLHYRGKTNMMDYFVKDGCLRHRKRNWIQPPPRDPKYEIKECLIADVEEEALDLEVTADEPFTEETIILNNEVETSFTFAEEQLQQVCFWKNNRIQNQLKELRKITIHLTEIIEEQLYARLLLKKYLPEKVQDDIRNFDQFRSDMLKIGKDLLRLEAVAENVICIVQKAGEYVRAVICSVGDGVAEVNLIDHGGCTNVTVDKLYFCNQNWAEIPGMALAIKLSHHGKAANWPTFVVNSLRENQPVIADIFEVDSEFIFARLRY